MCDRLFSYLNHANEATEFDVKFAVAHFAVLLSVAKPEELAFQIPSLLELSLNPEVPAEMREPLVRTAVVYAKSEIEAGFWIKHLEGELIPSYAFQALLRINAQHPRLVGFMSALWRRALIGEIKIRGPFATEKLASKQPDHDRCVRDVLRGVVDRFPELRQPLINDCNRYAFSRDWSRFLSKPRTSGSKAVAKVYSAMVADADDRLAKAIVSEKVSAAKGNRAGRDVWSSHREKSGHLNVKWRRASNWENYHIRADAKVGQIRSFHCLAHKHSADDVKASRNEYIKVIGVVGVGSVPIKIHTSNLVGEVKGNQWTSGIVHHNKGRNLLVERMINVSADEAEPDLKTGMHSGYRRVLLNDAVINASSIVGMLRNVKAVEETAVPTIEDYGEQLQ